MMQKTLYISDLDGTLLNSHQRLSSGTIEIINNLTKCGMSFSYATARSYVTAAKVTRGLASSIPAIVYNGAFIIESYPDDYKNPTELKTCADKLKELASKYF